MKKPKKQFSLAEYLAELEARRNPDIIRHSTLIQIAKARDCGTCQACGLFTPNTEGHHIHSIAEGGKDELNNIITLCTKCHKASPVDPSEFLQFQRQGGALWPEVRRQAFEALVTEPEFVDKTPQWVDNLCRNIRDSMFGVTHLIVESADDDREHYAKILYEHHAKVSRARKRYYGEPLDDINEYVTMFSLLTTYPSA